MGEYDALQQVYTLAEGSSPVLVSMAETPTSFPLLIKDHSGAFSFFSHGHIFPIINLAALPLALLTFAKLPACSLATLHVQSHSTGHSDLFPPTKLALKVFSSFFYKPLNPSLFQPVGSPSQML
jgi:hypothetical protein